MAKLHTFLILSGLMVMVSSASAAESITAEKVYMYAKTKNTTALKLLNEKIDVMDSNGNTALCLSMLKQDKNAYDMLKEAGANPYADCVNKIGMASGDKAATSTPASNGTFLGMGTVGWSITGAVVAGGAVAAAAGGGGGGGGGGSSSGSSTSDNSESNEKPTITCVNGSVSGNKCVCKDGWTGSTCATAKTCTYNTTSCNGGYEKTGNTCKSGNITYKECKAKSVPSGYTKNTCGNGYTQVDTFLSGTDTYYKCEANSCSGYVMSCGTGYHTTSDTCLSGATTMYKCEINDCSAYQASCGNGYDKTESCVSGATPYYTCTPKAIPTGYTKTACGEGYTQVDTFLSGNDTYYKCEAKAVPSGYTENSCGNGYEQKDTFISGIKTYYLCEVNSCDGYVTSCEDGYHTTSDTCQSGETTMYKCEANVCTTGSTSDSCPEGHHAELTGEYSGNQQCFVCVEDGVALDCGTHGTANGDVCQCDSGYAGTFCNLPDENHIIGTDGNLYEKLSCQNSGTQVNASCSCPDGWEGQYCQTAKTCSGYEESCAQGYHTTTDTCQSGNITMYKCETDSCDGYNYTTCPIGYAQSDSCQAGETIKLKCDNCADGYEKDTTGICKIKKATLDDVVGKHLTDDITANNEDLTITNSNNADVYGLIGSSNNVGSRNVLDSSRASIQITNMGDGNVYGLYGNSITNAYVSPPYSGFAKGIIQINNKGNGDVYGMKGRTVHNAYIRSNAWGDKIISDRTASGIIAINNEGNGNVYGMYASDFAQNADRAGNNTRAQGTIDISNIGNGNSYGIYSEGTAYTATSDEFISHIIMKNKGIGNAYGMYCRECSGAKSTYGSSESKISLINTSSGRSIGVYSKDGKINNRTTISLHNLGSGTAIGIYADGITSLNNEGYISITRDNFVANQNYLPETTTYSAETDVGGVAIGIYGAKGSNIKNSGGIFINGAQTAVGIYAESGAYVENTASISIKNSISAYGIWAEDESVTIQNSGNIYINEFAYPWDASKFENFIVLNGGKLFQDGALIVTNNSQNSPMSVSSVKPASLNLNDFGGTVVASDTSQFIVEGSISGDLSINNSVIENGFDTIYSVKDMIQAEDTSGLNLQSQSALFDATLQNNTDAMMTMKAFNDVVENSSVADFLQNNYAEGNNEKLFSTLKSAASVTELNNNIDDLFGKNMLSRMAFEDLSMLREVSFDMNNHLFKQEGAFAFGGNVSPSSYDNNIGSVGRYSLNGYNNGKLSFGVGVSITDVRTDDGHSDNSRFDRNFMMSAPIGYKTHGFELITASKMGYADGTYDRDGFNNMTYDGKVQKRMFALMNEARYPVKFGDLRLIPSAEFNMIGYNIKGHEDDKEYSLRIKSQNHYSVEAGFGLMAEKEFKPFKNHKFNVNGGVAVYHEFADPYELDVAMNGMSGTYRLQDEKRSDNRAVVRFGFGYELKDNIDVSAIWLTNIDREYRTDASIDMKYHF